MIVSLFFGGLKLRLACAIRPGAPPSGWPVRSCSRIAAWPLTAPTSRSASPALALLLGAVLAPTDPVLASAVSVNDAADHDRMRYGLSGEAGLNDGDGVPVRDLRRCCWAEHGGAGDWITGWALHRLLWAVPAALVLGYLLGQGGRPARDRAAQPAPRHRRAERLPGARADRARVRRRGSLGAWGFLAVFAAGVGLRRAEIRVVDAEPASRRGDRHARQRPPQPSAGRDARRRQRDAERARAARGRRRRARAETLSFGDTIERLLEVLLVVLVGAAWPRSGRARAAARAGAVRRHPPARDPAVASRGRRPTGAQRWLMGWFGIRGIGSLYYLCYALSHGLTGSRATEVAASRSPPWR